MKDLAIVRYSHGGSAKAVKSALNLYFRNRARAARVLALSIVIWLIPPVGSASEALEQKFDGVVVPRQWVQVVPQVNGVVSRILFVPGQRVSKGDVLFEMDADDFAIDVRIAIGTRRGARSSEFGQGCSRTSGAIAKAKCDRPTACATDRNRGRNCAR